MDIRNALQGYQVPSAQEQATLLQSDPQNVTNATLAALSRINSGAARRGANTFASIDSTGAITVSGGSGVSTPADVNVPPTTVSTANKDSGMKPITSSSELLAAMDEIRAEPDVIKSQAKTTQLIGAVEGHIADATSKLNSIADGIFGVAALESQLVQLKQKEQSLGWYTAQYGTADSDEVTAIRNTLEDARAKAVAYTNKMVVENPEIQAMRSMLPAFAQDEMNRRAKLSAVTDKEAEKADFLINKTTPQEKEVASLMDPSADNPLKQSVLAMTHKTSTKEFVSTAENIGNAKNLLALSTIPGNDFTPAVTAEKQARMQSAGLGEQAYKAAKDAALQDMAEVKRLANTKKGQEEALKLTAPNPTEVANQDILELKGKTTQEQAALSAEKNANRAADAFIVKKTNDFKNNISSWDTSSIEAIQQSPTLSKVYAGLGSIPGSNGKVPLAAMAAYIAGELKGQEQIAAKQDLLIIAKKATETATRGFYKPNVSSRDIEASINEQFISPEFRASQGYSPLDIVGQHLIKPYSLFSSDLLQSTKSLVTDPTKAAYSWLTTPIGGNK